MGPVGGIVTLADKGYSIRSKFMTRLRGGAGAVSVWVLLSLFLKLSQVTSVMHLKSARNKIYKSLKTRCINNVVLLRKDYLPMKSVKVIVKDEFTSHDPHSERWWWPCLGVLLLLTLTIFKVGKNAICDDTYMVSKGNINRKYMTY